MNRIKRHTCIAIFGAVLFFSCVVSAPTLLADELRLTPLLDTPKNRVYYNHLLESVRRAENSIKVLMATADFYPDHPKGPQDDLYDALISAETRGVEVMLIFDRSDWSRDITKTNEQTASYLRDRGLAVKFDDPEVTTHAKVIVVDERVVFLGSSNWNYPTYTETYQSNVKLVSPEVASFFGNVFDSLWKKERYEKVKPPAYPEGPALVPLLSSGKDRLYYKFAERLISGAEESIELVIFKVTRYSGFGSSKSNTLTEKLVEAADRGVEVRMILDVNNWSEEINQSNRETALWLLGQGIEKVKFDTRETTTHSKILLVDDESVLLGSTNWSYYSLDKNLEADLLVKDHPEVTQPFLIYFEKLWKKSDIPTREELSGGA